MKRKPRTLDGVWKECLRMWRWIVRQRKINVHCVSTLKEEWLKKEGYEDGSVAHDCFFCDYVNQRQGKFTNGFYPTLWCIEYQRKCPARRIDPDFRCNAGEYDFLYNPKAFLKKIEGLNRKRIAKAKRS